MQNGRGWADRRLSMVGGGGGLAPHRKWKKNSVRGNFNLFHLCFTNEIRGGGAIDTLYMQNERGWADMRLSMVGWGGWVWGGGARGVAP